MSDRKPASFTVSLTQLGNVIYLEEERRRRELEAGGAAPEDEAFLQVDQEGKVKIADVCTASIGKGHN